MKRRQFISKTAAGLTTLGFVGSTVACGTHNKWVNQTPKTKAKNIIFLVSDGMSVGTLTMADLHSRQKYGRGSHWVDYYRTGILRRSQMDTASASSLVTDSAAGSSSWGGGFRVPNGHLNISATGEHYMPILQKFKSVGKKTGCVTTVPITHATPAGFCVNNKSRDSQPEIALDYLHLRFDIMMGGGAKYFIKRADQRQLDIEFRNSGFQFIQTKTELSKLNTSQPIIGVFDDNGLPYELDRLHDQDLRDRIPSLAEMTKKAIDLLKNDEGFVLQVEGGKVDWAAHANDGPALIYDQLAFDDALKVAIDFAQESKDTLVIVTTDHGNANPGLYYGEEANDNFSKTFAMSHTNDWILNNINKDDAPSVIQDLFKEYQNIELTLENAQELKSKYLYLSNDNGWYNPYKLPFKELGLMQQIHLNIGFGSMEHSADFVELGAFGPGSELIGPHVINTDLHNIMLKASEVENKF